MNAGIVTDLGLIDMDTFYCMVLDITPHCWTSRCLLYAHRHCSNKCETPSI
jgi:hypothetical protein